MTDTNTEKYYVTGDLSGLSFCQTFMWAVGEEYEQSNIPAMSTSPTDVEETVYPFRLFRVEPRGCRIERPDTPWDNNPGFVSCKAWRVVEELPASLGLGPQAEQLEQLVARSQRLSNEDGVAFDKMRAEIIGSNEEAWTSAYSEVNRAVYESARIHSTRAIQDAAQDGAVDYILSKGQDSFGNLAQYAALEVAMALGVRDLISRGAYKLITSPRRRVIGPLHPDDVEDVLLDALQISTINNLLYGAEAAKAGRTALESAGADIAALEARLARVWECAKDSAAMSDDTCILARQILAILDEDEMVEKTPEDSNGT